MCRKCPVHTSSSGLKTQTCSRADRSQKAAAHRRLVFPGYGNRRPSGYCRSPCRPAKGCGGLLPRVTRAANRRGAKPAWSSMTDTRRSWWSPQLVHACGLILIQRCQIFLDLLAIIRIINRRQAPAVFLAIQAGSAGQAAVRFPVKWTPEITVKKPGHRVAGQRLSGDPQRSGPMVLPRADQKR